MICVYAMLVKAVPGRKREPNSAEGPDSEPGRGSSNKERPTMKSWRREIP